MILFKTERLQLRAVSPDMFEPLHEMMSDWEVVRRTGTWPWPPDPAFTRDRCQPFDAAAGFQGIIFRLDTAIGSLSLKDQDLGYTISRDHWGHGYATEIGRGAVDYVFANYDWPRITACVYVDNDASARVLEKLGFSEGPRCKGLSASRGGTWPTRTFTLPRPT